MSDHIKRGNETLARVKEILGESYGYPELSFNTDKTKELTDRQFEALRELGWEGDGSHCWVYRGVADHPNSNSVDRVNGGYEFMFAGGHLLISDHAIARFRQRILWRYKSDNASSIKDGSLAKRIRSIISNGVRGDEARKELRPWLKNLTDDAEPYLDEHSRTCFVLRKRKDKNGKVVLTCFSAICPQCGTAHLLSETCPKRGSRRWTASQDVFNGDP